MCGLPESQKYAWFTVNSVLTVPEVNLVTYLTPGENELGPIENPQNDFLITCSMGMFTANVKVIPSTL